MRKKTLHLTSFPYFLLTLPIYFVLHGYVTNFPAVPTADAGWVLSKYLLITAALFLISYLAFRSFTKASLFAFSLLFFQCYFGNFLFGIKDVLGNSFITRYSFQLPFIVIAFIFLFLFLKKSTLSFRKLFTYLNSLLILLILIDVGVFFFKTEKRNDLAHQPLPNYCDTCAQPDIYFIIADEYAGAKELKEVLKFDNSSFENSLKQRGFHIVPNSTSNYNYTPYSIASILGMNYLQGLSKKSNDQQNRNISYQQINNNPLVSTLRKRNYTFYNFSLFDFAGNPTIVDNMFFSTREKLLTAQTFTQRINHDIRFNLITRLGLQSEIRNFAYLTHDNNEQLLQKTLDVAKEGDTSPKFVFTHLMMPHYPYFYNKEGKPYPTAMLQEGKQVEQNAYVEYLQFCNTRFLNMVDSILANSTKPPVIILMGDHGFRHFTTPVSERYHFMNLNAVYLPSKNYQAFYEGMSGVNQFRALLNTVYNQGLPMLTDSTSFMLEY